MSDVAVNGSRPLGTPLLGTTTYVKGLAGQKRLKYLVVKSEMNQMNAARLANTVRPGF